MRITKGVYCLTAPNGKRYVGLGVGARGINARWWNYKSYACYKQPKLLNALKKYGAENFKYEVILETDDIDRAKRVEQQLIALWNLQNDKFGYNITAGGDGSLGGRGRLGMKHSQETKDKIRNAHIGKKRSKEHRSNISSARTGIWHKGHYISMINDTGKVITGNKKDLAKIIGISNSHLCKELKNKDYYKEWRICQRD